LTVLDLNESTNNNNDVRNEISKLDIANGLKEILIDHRFTIEGICKISAEDLSIALGTDEAVARIIINAAKKLRNMQ
jgi:hypothetical protein